MMLPRLLRCAACAASAGPSARLDRAARLATSAPAPAAALSRYAGKVAMVTASTAGIGLAIARRLAQEGAAVVISSRREANVQGAVAALKA